VTGLAYFTVASTLANRILSLTYRLSGVFFPAASALAARGELERLRTLYLKASRYVVFINASVLVLVAVFSYQILYYWMNPQFARAGQVVLAGDGAVAVHRFAHQPAVAGQRRHGPSALFRHVRAGARGFGLVVVYLGVDGWGIAGAAWGHLLASVLLTCAFLVAVHGRTVPARLGDLCARPTCPACSGSGWWPSRPCRQPPVRRRPARPGAAGAADDGAAARLGRAVRDRKGRQAAGLVAGERFIVDEETV
jgi:hypothetical protein